MNDPQIAVLGYGRFGRALSGLLAEHRIRVRALDPNADVPDDQRAHDAADLVTDADVVVIATPIDQLRPALQGLDPLLSEDQLVIDVGSVKQGPIDAMSEVLGESIPWVGTHPLFGPDNIARGDRDLRAVVCPNPLHPRAAQTARALYERIGCQVIEQDPDEHDRVMAKTHAMAFFVAKGLLDIGIDDDLPFAPPSFQALAQTIDTVRSDAGHLFVTIERANPHAAEARQDLIDALSEVHGRLERDALDPGSIPESGLSLPIPADAPPALNETRDLIDELDLEIVQLLARRIHLTRRAGTIKADHAKPVRDPAREHELLDARMEWARSHGLPEERIADIFSAVLRLSRRAQEE